jgi:ABC-2 type transport system ATP-binding protein
MTSASEHILSIKNLSKDFRNHWTYKKIPAIKNLSFDVLRGETFGFLGHNGAGKTTTIKTILGLLKQTSGEIFYQGRPLRNAADRASIGYLPELPYFYEHLSVEETLRFFLELYDLSSTVLREQLIEETIERVQLGHKRKAPVKTLSKGLQQRLAFAQAIIHSPQLLFLDEPFSGLDPLGRIDLRNLILDLKKSGTTIILSSHILSDVEFLCDRVAIMANGVLQTEFALKDLRKLYGEQVEVEFYDNEELKTECFNSYEEAVSFLDQLRSGGVVLERFQRKVVHLEEIFMKITKQAQLDAGIRKLDAGVRKD